MVAMPKTVRTKRITNPDIMSETEYCEIKTYYSDWDRRTVLSAASSYSQDESGKTIIRGTLQELTFTKRRAALVGWSLLYDDGETPIPFTEENIKQLPTEVATWLDQKIDEEWNNLGTPLTSEEAERKAKEGKVSETTFPRPVEVSDGRETDSMGQNEHKRARDRGAGRSIITTA